MILAAVALATVAILFLGFSIFLDKKEQRKADEIYSEDLSEIYSSESQSIRYHGKWYNLNYNVKTYLLMGVDKFEDNLSDPSYFVNDQCSDFLMLLAVDTRNEKVSEILINRDTMANVGLIGIDGDSIGTKKLPIALSHTYGSGREDSCQNTLKAVSNLFYDLPIEKYYCVTMDAVPVLTDALGGVNVYVKDYLEHEDPYLEQGKNILITGEHVLPFVRARMSVGSGTNLERMDRQIAYLKAAKEKGILLMERDDSFLFRLFEEISDYSFTNLSAVELSQLSQKLENYEFGEILTLFGENKKGEKYMEFYPDQERLQDLIVDIWYEEAENLEE